MCKITTDTKKFPDKESGSSPVKSLHSSGSSKKYSFPADLSSGGKGGDAPFLSFRVAKYSRAFRTDIPKASTLATIHLPIPASLQVGYNVNYNNVDLGTISGTASRSDDIASARQILDGEIGNALGQAFNALGDEELQDTALTAAGRAAIRGVGNSFGLNAVDAAALLTGIAVNPHSAVLFQGVNFREHQFTYRMMASNRQESDNIRSILNTFRYSMYPSFEGILSKASVNLFNFPEQWFLRFSKNHREYLYDFMPSVLVSMNVNYNGSSMPAFFEDTKAPVHIEATLTFREVEIMTKETINNEMAQRPSMHQGQR